jgi:DNA polymerase-3 subunit beta
MERRQASLKEERVMKVIAQTAALQEALALASSIVAVRTPKPVLQCVKLIAKDKTLTLLATDLEASCRYQLTAVQVEKEGQALVPAERLSGIVRESGSDESLSLDTDKETCHVRGKASHFKVFGFDPAEFPAVAEFEGDGDFQVSAGELASMINKTIFATAKTHSHYAISGILMEASGKKLQLVATDGHRLAQAKGTLTKAAARDISAIVPAKLMTLIQRIAGNSEETLEVKIQENQIMVRTARAMLASSLVQGNFPKYGDVIPKETTHKATINSLQFEHSLRQAALLTNEESKGVRLSFKADEVTLTSRAPETGEAEVSCPVTMTGEPMDIAFNPAFLIDALKVTQADTISLEMNASNKPAVIKTGNDFLYVLMPVDLG